jgi:hypothetical protein
MSMTGWNSFGDGYEYPEWNSLIYIKTKNESEIQRVFYGSEEDKNPDKSIPNIVKCGKIGLKLQWKYEL